jgi:glycerophosphoryl diester phosphodiesterase
MRRKVLRIVAGFVVLLVLALVVLSLLSKPVPDHPFFEGDQFLVIAHQGGEGLRPSNTMASFSHAVELGVDVLEMDIHSTADDVIVVMHDDTVDRTTDGTGRIQDLTLQEIQSLDAGYYWTDDSGESYPYRGQGITVPTLEELFIAFPDMSMNIEIKQESPSIVESFCQLLRDYEKVDSVLVASFHQATMEEFREKCPGVASSMVESEIRRFFILNTIFLGAIFRAPSEAIQIPEFSGNLHVATERFVKAAHGHNVQVHVWTVNEIEDMERMIDIGVDGIITDRPDRLIEVVGQR